jgi:hypothetical protein
MVGDKKLKIVNMPAIMLTGEWSFYMFTGVKNEDSSQVP